MCELDKLLMTCSFVYIDNKLGRQSGFSENVFFLQNFTKAMRLFVGEPVWKAYNRPADDFDIRQKYVASLQGSL